MKQPPLQTEEDLGLVKEYILLPILLDVLERDIQILKIVQLKMASIYVEALQRVQDKVMADVAILRKKMREHGIKVFEQQRGSLCVRVDYLCRGYEHTFSMLWGLVKAEVGQRLSSYIDVVRGVSV